MALHIYKGGSILHHSEIDMLNSLINTLRKQYDGSNQFCYLFIGYQCLDRQVDATIIKQDAILNIELKDYTVEKTIVGPQGDFILFPKKNIRKIENPIEQVRQQNYAIKNLVHNNQGKLFGGRIISSASELDVCGCIVLRYVKHTNTEALGKQKAFLKVADLNTISEIIQEYKGRDILDKQSILRLDERFAKGLSEILNLEEVEAINNIAIQNDENDIRLYLSNISFNLLNYVYRPDLEKQLLKDRSVIVVGSPGAGKSTTVEMIVYHHATEELRRETIKKIPYLLKLSDNHDILDGITSEIGISEEHTKELLEAGRFFIILDGVDEMVDYKKNWPRLVQFATRFSQNQFIFTIRRDVYNNLDSAEYFQKLKTRLKMVVVEIEQFESDELTRLLKIKLGENYNVETELHIRSFLDTLPETTPLEIEMAVEILQDKDVGNLVYENKGKWYDEFFKRRLKRECRKTKSAGRDSDIFLNNVLTRLGEYAILNEDPFFEKEFVYRTINEGIREKLSEYYDLLLRSEILRPVNVKITNGKHIQYDEQLQFFHQTYLDFYIAKSLIGKLVDEELLYKVLLEQNLQNSLVMLSGLEPDQYVVDKIIRSITEKGNIELACTCLINTKNCSSDIPTEIAKEIIDWAEYNKYYKKNALLSYIEKYGTAILTPELEKYIERFTNTDIINKIDWEAYKSLQLKTGEISEIFKKTPRYAYKYDKIKGKYIESCSRLASRAEAQNLDGYKFYSILTQIQSLEELLQLALDDSYDSFLRSILFYELRQKYYSDYLFWEKVITDFRKNADRWLNYHEDLRWEIIPFFIYYEDIVGENVVSPEEAQILANEAIEIFWKENSGPVQLRILVGSYLFPDFIRNEFFMDNLYHYQNDQIFDLERLEPIWEEEFYGEVDWAISTVSTDYYPIIGDYRLCDFQDETYAILMKCVTINDGVYLKINDQKFTELLVKYSYSENEKLKSVAKWALESIENPKF
jgi:hypothetical protein